MFCTYCGASIADGAKFCPECGKQQAAASVQNLCPFCGAALESDSVFCDNCGKKLGDPAPSYSPKDTSGTGYASPQSSDSRIGTSYSRTKTASSGRGFTVSARPEMRILGIPVRGKAMWIVLGVIAVAVIGLVVFSKLGGDEEEPVAENAPRVFTAQEDTSETPEEEAESEGSGALSGFAARAAEAQQAALEKQEQEPEPASEPESQPESEPEPAPEPEPESEPEAPQSSAQLPYVDSLGRPAATDFAWIADVQSGDLTGSFLGNDELIGKWKGEIIYDGVWELVYVTIDTTGQIIIEPYQINYGDGWVDEMGDDPYLFDGVFDISSIFGTGGYGSISLYLFLESDGVQYGVGTFSVNDGSTADVYMVRP